MTTFTCAGARKGDVKVEVYTTEIRRVEEIVLIGGQEAKTVVSLIFRDYPMGTAVRPMTDDEFLQTEGEPLCLYAGKGTEEDIQFVGYVDLMERQIPRRAEDEGSPRPCVC